MLLSIDLHDRVSSSLLWLAQPLGFSVWNSGGATLFAARGKRLCLPPAANQIRVFVGFRTSGCETNVGVPSASLLSYSPTSLFCPFLPSHSPSLPLKSRPLKSSWKVWGAVSSPSGVWGGAPAETEFGVF